MIRRQVYLEFPIELVREVFVDTDRWPLWMPGVSAVRTVEQRDGYRLLEVSQTFFGYTFVQTLECREVGATVCHRQHRGWFEKFEVDWTFEPGSGRDQTRVSVALDFGMGRLRFLSPKAFVEVWMENHLDTTLERARSRARVLAAR